MRKLSKINLCPHYLTQSPPSLFISFPGSLVTFTPPAGWGRIAMCSGLVNPLNYGFNAGFIMNYFRTHNRKRKEYVTYEYVRLTYYR